MQTSATTLAAWLNSPETRALRAYLHHRRQDLTDLFLAGAVPVDQLTQGKAAGLHEIANLLSKPPEQVSIVFETALKGARTK